MRILVHCPIVWVKFTLKSWVRISPCRRPNLTNELSLSCNQLTSKWNSKFCLKFVNVDLDEASPRSLKISKARYRFDKSVRMATVGFSGRKINKQSILEILTNSHSYHVSDVAVYSPSFLRVHPDLISLSPGCLPTSTAWVFSLSIILSQLSHNPWSIYRSKMNN